MEHPDPAHYLAASPYGWYHVDAHGNKQGVNAQFTPPLEQLAFKLNDTLETEIVGIFIELLPEVVEILTRYHTVQNVLAHLPDGMMKIIYANILS